MHSRPARLRSGSSPGLWPGPTSSPASRICGATRFCPKSWRSSACRVSPPSRVFSRALTARPPICAASARSGMTRCAGCLRAAAATAWISIALRWCMRMESRKESKWVIRAKASSLVSSRSWPVLEEAKLVAQFWLRSGNAPCASNVVGFTLELLSNLPRHLRLRLVRADSGFCEDRWLSLAGRTQTALHRGRGAASQDHLLAAQRDHLDAERGPGKRRCRGHLSRRALEPGAAPDFDPSPDGGEEAHAAARCCSIVPVTPTRRW